MQALCQCRRAYRPVLRGCVLVATLGAALPAFALWGKKPEPPPPSLDHPPTILSLTSQQEQQASAMAHYATGIALELSKSVDQALPEYQKALELDPQHTALALRLSQIYLARKDYTNALDVLKSSTLATPDSPEPWVFLGIAYRTMENNAEAVTALRQALKIDPTHQGALRTLLDVYLQQGQDAEVIDLLGQSWKQVSMRWNYWIGLGDIYALVLKQKPSLVNRLDRQRIRECYEKALAMAPDEPEILLRLADIYSQNNDLKSASAVYEKLLNIRPDAPQLRERLAYAYSRSDQKEKAVTLLQDIIKRNPLRFEIYNMLGELYEDLEKDPKAIESYQESLVLNPDQIEVYIRIAIIQLRLKKPDDAFAGLAKAKERFPTKYQIPYLYGLAYSDKKQYKEAIAAFIDADTLATDTPDETKPTAAFYFAFGSAYERAGEIEKAVALFRKCLEMDPKNHHAANYLGYMWADRGERLDEALKLIQDALAQDPENPAYLDSLGWVYYKQGKYPDALKVLEHAVSLMQKDSDATVLDHLAETLLKLDRPAEAITQWRRALQLEPENKEIAGKLQQHDASKKN
jgi:tetratricopeptide (TPR) repeat protein